MLTELSRPTEERKSIKKKTANKDSVVSSTVEVRNLIEYWELTYITKILIHVALLQLLLLKLYFMPIIT